MTTISVDAFNVFTDGLTILLLGILLVPMLAKPDKETRYIHSFNLAVFLSILYCVADIVFRFFNGKAEYTALIMIINFSEMVLLYVIAIVVSRYLFEIISLTEKRKYIITKVFLIGAIVLTVALLVLVKNGYVFGVENGYYVRRENWFFCWLYPLFCVLVDCVTILTGTIDSKQALAIAAFCVVPPLGLLFSFYAEGYSTISLLLLVSALILYIYVYAERTKELYRSRAELEVKRTEALIAQIQPHFLYNCITSCVALCRIDPEKAGEMMTNFGKYLRVNLDVFKQKKPIPFETELEHIKVYLSLETVRFEDKLTVEFAIGESEFLVPALSIQPLVENAVKHGISASDRPGVVTVASWEEDDSYMVEVKDNGCGFDLNAPLDDHRSHIGLENVRHRLEMISGAQMTIDSKIGEGTVVTVSFPKKTNSMEAEA